jgi:hypothetical protein
MKLKYYKNITNALIIIALGLMTGLIMGKVLLALFVNIHLYSLPHAIIAIILVTWLGAGVMLAGNFINDILWQRKKY